MADATITSPPVSAPAATTSTSSTTSSTSGSSTSTTGIADNFQTFLTLLTTQLQNQNPLDPLDTNQFTQQLVQFAGVEQQLKTNDQLTSMVALQKSAAATQALVYVGKTVAVDGSTAQFNSSATWSLNSANAANASISIANSAGQTVYTGTYQVSQGSANFVWDGKGNDGTQYPAGAYKLTATGKDTSGQDVAISTQVQGNVDSVDLTSSPALLSIGGQNYTTDQIKRVVDPATASSTSGTASS